jgi:hypothetical protein
MPIGPGASGKAQQPAIMANITTIKKVLRIFFIFSLTLLGATRGAGSIKTSLRSGEALAGSICNNRTVFRDAVSSIISGDAAAV